MASDKKIITCANDPNFAIICTFFHKFSKPLNLGHPNIQLLQEWLENSEEVSAGLKQLHIKLLRKLRKTVHETAWETALSKFCWFYSAQDAWEIERFGYKKASLRVKLRVLRELVESQFERNGKFRTETQIMSADELRTEPIGRDKLGHSYWLAQDPDCNLRVFQEHLDEEIWQVVATNRDELVTLINRLRGNEVVLPSLVGAIDEDSSSNSCSGTVIKPPPPEERDESQDDDTAIINNTGEKKNVTDDNEEKINERIPNIKIKFDKIVENNDSGNLDHANSTKVVEKDNESDEEEEEEGYEEEVEEEEGEEEDDEEDISEGEEDDKVDDEKSKKTEEKNTPKNAKKEPNKKNSSKSSDHDKKVKPLIISQSKITSCTTIPDDKTTNLITLSLSKKRSLADIEPDFKESEDMAVVKKARPTLLDTKRQKNISKYEKFKDDSEDEDDEEGDGDDEEEEGEEETGEEEEVDDDGEGEEEDTEEDETVGEPIEEKVLIVKGSGSGKDCKSSFKDFLDELKSQQVDEENIVGDVIEEDVFYVCGEGWGAEYLVGNPSKESESKSPPKATFYFGQPGCLKLSPVKKKPASAETDNEKTEETKSFEDKNNDENESTTSKQDILHNSIVTNGENEIEIESNVKIIETNNENHTNNKSIQDETKTLNKDENEKLNPITIECSSNLQSDVVLEKNEKGFSEKLENKILDNIDSKATSQFETCETNITNDIASVQPPSKTSDELNQTSSMSEKKKIIPEILISDNEPIDHPKSKCEEITEQEKIKLNSPKNLEEQIANLHKSAPDVASVILEAPEEIKNTIEDINSCNTVIFENIEKINEVRKENTQEKINLIDKDETKRTEVLEKVDEVKETDAVKPISIELIPEKCVEVPLNKEKLIQDFPKTLKPPLGPLKCEKHINDPSQSEQFSGPEKITQSLVNKKCLISAERPIQSLTVEKSAEEFLKKEKSNEDILCPETLSKPSQQIEKNSAKKVNTAVQNLSEDTNILKIVSEDKSEIAERIKQESVLTLNIVPQSPSTPKKISSPSITKNYKPEKETKPDKNPISLIANRKRRLSPTTDINSSHMPPVEKPRRISESSETDLNSENVEGEFIEEDDENLGDDVGGKRARFRLKIVNTDLRKKIEAQRKICSKDTGSSSSGEDERPRKKLSPRKPFSKYQIEETSKIIEKIDAEIKSDQLQLEVKKNKTPEKLHSVSVIKSSNLVTAEAFKPADDITVKNKIEEKIESPLINQNIKAVKLPEKSLSTKIINKKISPNKLADKIEFLKQSKEKNLPSTTSCTAIQQISTSTTASKEVVLTKEAMTIKKRISPKKIEDKIEILKQNIEKTANLSSTQKTENIEIQEIGRARKRSSPPKKIAEVSKDIKSIELSSVNPKTEVSDKLHTNKIRHDLKGGESDEEIPRKRTISEESSDLKAIIVNLSENKKKAFEGHSSTDEDRSRKRTICENQSAEQITQQPVEKSSKTEELNYVQPENLEFNTKKREAARKIAENKLKIELRNSEEDDRPKKRTITSGGTDQGDVKRSEKFSKIEKPVSVSASTSCSENIFSKPHIAQEQIVPEDLSKKNSIQFPVNKKKTIVIPGAVEERVKMKFPQKDNIETSDKKLKLSSTVLSAPQKLSEPQKEIIFPHKLVMQGTSEVLKSDVEEIGNSKIITSAGPNCAESEEERPRKRTINTDISSPQDRPLNEIKKDKIEELQAMKSLVSPPEKLKIMERNEDKIKIVVKTCSIPDSTPSLPILFERIVSDRVSPEISKISTIKNPPKIYTEVTKKSAATSVKKSTLEPVKLLEDSIDVIKNDSPVAVKTRHTRRAGDSEPLLELTLAQTKRKSRQTISQTPKQVTPATASTICPAPIGKKAKKDDEVSDDKLEFVECKVEPKDEKLDENNYDENKLEENPLEKVIGIAKQINETPTNNLKKPAVTATTSKDTPSKATGRQQRRKREIDTSNIIDTESEATPMRQSRRIAQLKIREEAERRKLEEIALKKMKEDLKRKKKEEKKQFQDDPTVVTEPSGSDSDYKDESDIELKKKFDKKKKGKKSGWSSGSNEEDDHDADDDDLFKYPASDHGSPLFKSDHEFSPESDIEDESQVVPLKRARTARKEGESVEQRSGMTERDIDESCQKCGKSDHPEWILLCDKCDKGYHCSCLSPVLFIIPEGDWFCPPCQQEQLIAALEKHLKEFDNLILSKKLEEEERIKTLELEAAEIERQKERDALEAAENELENKNGHKKKSEGTDKNRRRKATDNTCNDNSKDSENGTESSDVSSNADSNSRKKRSERRNQRKKDRKNINRKKVAREGSSKSSASNSSNSENNNSKSSATDSDDEPIYKLRKRRQTNISYRFNDYDELINRAIKKDENQGIIYSDDAGEDEEGAGNLGRGKDISTIIEADKEEKARQKQKDDEEKGIKLKETKVKTENLKTKTDDDSGSDFEPLKTKQKTLANKKQRKKKNRKLNCLDISSEDDGSDEDFRTSSEDDDDDESFSVSSGSDTSLEMYRRRSKKGKNSRKTSRRAARERKKIRDFVVDGSDDETDEEEEKPKLKKKRKQVESDFSESDLDDDDDELSEDLDSDELCDDDSTDSDHSGWRPSKRKKQKTASAQKKKTGGKSGATANPTCSGKSPRQSIGKEIPKIIAAKKKPKRMDDDEKPFKASGIVKKNRQRISDTGSSSSSSDGAGGRKTRGRRLFYMDDYDDEDSSDGGIKPGVKRPDTPPEEREKFIKRQEEIKRMLAEKNVSKETKEGAVKAAPLIGASQSTKVSEKTGAGDSLSAVPLSVIRAAKALDVDYLQRKGEIDEEHSENEDDDEAAAASAFGDDLPDDFNPDDMDEEAIAKMMEEEDFPQHQQMKVLPSPGDILKQQYKKLNTPPKVPTQPPVPQQTSVIQDPIMRKRLPMPTFHPLMRPTSGGLSHLPLLQSALTNPIGMVPPPQQLTPGVPMSHHRPPQQHTLIQPTQPQIPPPTSKPRGRRKKITPLRDPVEKAAAVAAATTTSTSTTIPQNLSLPTNLSGKEAPPAGGVSSLPTSAIQPPIPSGNLNVAQPPQLYKPPTNSPQPSVITRMPQMPPRQRFPDQGSRYYPPTGAAGVSPNQLLPPHHRSPGSLRHGLMHPIHHQPPPSHHTLRPSYAGGPPPLRPGGPPLRPGGPPLRSSGPPLRAGATPSSLRHSASLSPRGPPPTSSTTPINIGNGIGRDQTLARQQQAPQFSSDQFAGTHRSRHPTPPLNPYRPPLYGSPGYPPAPPPQHSVGTYPPGPPYGSYYPPPSLGPPTHSSTPSNSVIVAAAAAVSAAAASTVVVTPTRLAIPTSVVHHPPNQQPPPRSSSVHPNLPPPPHRPTKVTTLETYDAKRTPPPLDLQQNQPSALLHARVTPNDDDDDDDEVVNPTTGTTSNSGASEFSGLVSYFSSQHDEF